MKNGDSATIPMEIPAYTVDRRTRQIVKRQSFNHVGEPMVESRLPIAHPPVQPAYRSGRDPQARSTCVRCREIESIIETIRPILDEVDSRQKGIANLQQQLFETSVELRKVFKALDQISHDLTEARTNHLRCYVCRILIGEGHEWGVIRRADGTYLCGRCEKELTKMGRTPQAQRKLDQRAGEEDD